MSYNDIYRDAATELSAQFDPDNIGGTCIRIEVDDAATWIDAVKAERLVEALSRALKLHAEDDIDLPDVVETLLNRVDALEAANKDRIDDVDDLNEAITRLGERTDPSDALDSLLSHPYSDPSGTLLSRDLWNAAAWAFAAREGKQVSFTYSKLGTVAVEIRQVRPSEVRNAGTLFVGHDVIAGDFRAFRSDRVESYVVVTA